MRPRDADGLANSVDANQTAPLGLFDQSSLSCMFRIFMVFHTNTYTSLNGLNM